MTLKNINFSTVLTVIMLAIFASMVAISFGYPAKARFMPLVVGLPGIVFCLIQLGLDLFRSPTESAAASVGQQIAAASAPEGSQHEELPEFGPHTARQEVVMWSYFVSFIAGVILFGFYISVPIMLLTFLRRQSEASWKFALALAIAATLALYLMFGRLLGIELHPGFVTRWAIHALGLGAI
ncbi:tripartite tricarboxylate transporter TctB family protein [Rhizobium sp. KDH_Rht_773_N]